MSDKKKIKSPMVIALAVFSVVVVVGIIAAVASSVAKKSANTAVTQIAGKKLPIRYVVLKLGSEGVFLPEECNLTFYEGSSAVNSDEMSVLVYTAEGNPVPIEEYYSSAIGTPIGIIFDLLRVRPITKILLTNTTEKKTQSVVIGTEILVLGDDRGTVHQFKPVEKVASAYEYLDFPIVA